MEYADAPHHDVQIFRGAFDRLIVKGQTCQFALTPRRLVEIPSGIEALLLQSVYDGFSARIEDVLEGRETWANWPPNLFRFVRDHIGAAMLKNGFTAHESIAVVQAMSDAEAKLTWHKV